MQNKIIRQYCLLSALFNAGGLSIISAIYVAYLIRNGLSLFESNLVNAVFFLALFICEIPTGAFADVFGRKASLMLACALMGVSMFMYGCSHSFVWFVATEAVAGAGSAFETGAFQAWLVDSLKHHGYTGEYHRIFGRANLLTQIAGGFGAVAGSYLSAWHPSLPWFFGGTVLTVTMIIVHFVMKEDYFEKKAFSWKLAFTAMWRTAKTSIRYGREDKTVRFVLITTGTYVFAVQGLNMYWQPYFKGHGVGEQYLGFLFDAMVISFSVGTFAASRMKSLGNEKRLILTMLAVSGILVVVMSTMTSLPLVVAIFLLHEVPRGTIQPFMDSYLQQRIPSAERATIASFCATAPHIGGAIGLVVSGAIAQGFGIPGTWCVSGVILILGALLLAKNGNGVSS